MFIELESEQPLQLISEIYTDPLSLSEIYIILVVVYTTQGSFFCYCRDKGRDMRWVHASPWQTLQQTMQF